MVNVLVTILAIWGGVFAEYFFIAFTGISLFLIAFFFAAERIKPVHLIAIFGIVSVALDTFNFLPIGTTIVLVGVIMLLYKVIAGTIEDQQGIVSYLLSFIVFIVYYLLLRVVVEWNESSFSLRVITWTLVGGSIVKAFVSVIILGVVRFATSQFASASQTSIRIR